MHKYKLADFDRGWLVGDFEPSIIKTKDFEFTVQHYQSGDKSEAHVHKIADEITVVVSGEFKMNEEILKVGDVIHLSPGEAADFYCIQTGYTAVVKTPSVIGDKYLV